MYIYITLPPYTGGWKIERERVIGTTRDSCNSIVQQQFRYLLKNIGGPEKGRLLEQKCFHLHIIVRTATKNLNGLKLNLASTFASFKGCLYSRSCFQLKNEV